MKHLISLILVCVFAASSFAHKHYVSIANLEYNNVEKQIEVSLQLTAHDFEHILENHFKKRIHLEDISDSSKFGQFIISYIEQNMVLTSANQKAKFNYVGKEVNVRDQLFFYFTFTRVLDPLHIILQNSILFQLFSEQQNVMHYKRADVTKTATCTSISPIGEFRFEG